MYVRHHASVSSSGRCADASCADTSGTLTLWSTAEPAVTIMAASLPMMRLLVQTFRRKKDRSDDLQEIMAYDDDEPSNPGATPPNVKAEV